jgi:hypothetical protein
VLAIELLHDDDDDDDDDDADDDGDDGDSDDDVDVNNSKARVPRDLSDASGLGIRLFEISRLFVKATMIPFELAPSQVPPAFSSIPQMY